MHAKHQNDRSDYGTARMRAHFARWGALFLAAIRSLAVLRFLAALGLACGWSHADGEELAQKRGRPNVVVIITDDQGYGDVGVHGNDKIRTPNLDRFSREGLEMSRFYCSPVCAPTRASLMTGRYYYRSGIIHTSRGGAKMHGEEVTLAEILSAAGYRTGIFGKWHLGDNYPMRPQDQGFQESLVHKSGGITQTPDTESHYDNPRLWKNGKAIQAEGYCTDIFFNAAGEFIDSHRDEPFFAYIAANAPHTPLEIADSYVAPYKAMGLDDTTAAVYGMVQNIDENFGRLMARLDDLGVRDNTLVIFLTDNGPQQPRYTAGLRGRKTMTYEGGIRVPFFVQWPAQLKGGRKVDRISAHIDITPTLVALCAPGASGLPEFDGRNVWPLWSGNEGDWPDRMLFFQCHRGLEPKRYQNCAVVTDRWKMVGYPEKFNVDNLDTSGTPDLQLYDMETDWQEQHDLAEKRPNVLVRLRAAYDKWFDDVESTRQFEPGVIHLGNDAENPSLLCFNQDGTFQGKNFLGWSVAVERAGRYRIAPVDASAKLDKIRFDEQEIALKPSDGAMIAVLPKGEGMLEIPVAGDVNIEYLGP